MTRLWVTALAVFAVLCLPPTAFASPVDDLQKVGSARLKVLLWTIYDSTLYSPDGNYERVEPDLALELTYRREIAAQELIERTAQEWQNLGLDSREQASWLEQLKTLWPDVRPGDTLTLRVDAQLGSRFYFNDQFIGELEDADFTRRFLAIWLDSNSRYPRQRAELLGTAG